MLLKYGDSSLSQVLTVSPLECNPFTRILTLNLHFLKSAEFLI